MSIENKQQKTKAKTFLKLYLLLKHSKKGMKDGYLMTY